MNERDTRMSNTTCEMAMSQQIDATTSTCTAGGHRFTMMRTMTVAQI